MRPRISPALCRSWLSVPGAEPAAHRAAAASGADVCILELEDFTPPALRPPARALAPNIETAAGIMRTYAIARASPRVAAIVGSTEDLAADLRAELAYARARLHLEARAIVAAFEAARASGRAGARLGNRLIEVPVYLNARRRLDRARAFTAPR